MWKTRDLFTADIVVLSFFVKDALRQEVIQDTAVNIFSTVSVVSPEAITRCVGVRERHTQDKALNVALMIEVITLHSLS